MNRAVLSAVLMSVAGALLSGCAAQTASYSSKMGSDLYDREYMLAVEHKAAQRGVQVRWIAPPLKTVAENSNDRSDDHQ